MQLWGLPDTVTPDALTAIIQQRPHEAGIVAEEEPLLLLQFLDVMGEAEARAALSPEARRARTFALLWQLFLHASQRQPLVLAVENLHWSDPTSDEWLTALAARVGGTPILLLATYRPGYRPPWLAHSWATQVALPPLTPPDSLVVVQAVPRAAQLPTRQQQAIVVQAAGNPFFLEELAWAAVAHGDQAYPLPLPDTIQVVLAARLDQLSAETKHLAQVAAVIGPEVPVSLLAAITKLPEATLHGGLAHLQGAEFLYETRSYPERVYTFKHALTHEAAYSSLLQERRRAFHARIVEAIETLYPDRLVGQVDRLAHHALRGEVWDKAVTYGQQAGARARNRSAPREAAASYEQALQALAHLPEHGDTRGLAIELRRVLGVQLSVLGEYGRCLVLLGEAAALARALGDQARLVQVLARMAQVLRFIGDHDGAIAAGRQALELAVALDDSALQVRASHHLGQAYYAIGDFGRAAALLRWNVEAADWESGTPSTDVRIQSQAWLTRTLSALGAFAEGWHHGEAALHRATLEGQGSIPIVAHGCLGHLYLAQGDLEHAIRVLEQGLALCHASAPGTGYHGSRRTWALPLRCRGAWRKGAHC